MWHLRISYILLSKWNETRIHSSHISLACLCRPVTKFLVFLLHVMVLHEEESRFPLADSLAKPEYICIFMVSWVPMDMSHDGDSHTPFLWPLHCEGLQAAWGSLLFSWLLPPTPPKWIGGPEWEHSIRLRCEAQGAGEVGILPLEKFFLKELEKQEGSALPLPGRRPDPLLPP